MIMKVKCDLCKKKFEMFNVSRNEWFKVVEPEYSEFDIFCEECYDKLRKLADKNQGVEEMKFIED